jgi:hypothetical protein
MLSTPETQAIGYDMFTAAAAGIYPVGSNPTTGIAAGLHRLGTRMRTRDGRTFHFCRMGAVAGVAGSLYQASAPVANHLALTPSAAAVGATAITLTLGATAATQNQYAEGWLQVDTTPGNGIMYGIDSHLAIALSTAGVINLAKDDAIQVALTTASRLGLIANPFADIIITPTTRTGLIVGVPLFAIPIGQYGWVQTWGPCPVLINGTPAVTAPVVNGATTAGTVDVWTAAAQPTATYVGDMMQVGVSTKNNAVYLRLCQ